MCICKINVDLKKNFTKFALFLEKRLRVSKYTRA